MSEASVNPPARRRADVVVSCCKSLVRAVLPIVAMAAARFLRDWAEHHRG